MTYEHAPALIHSTRLRSKEVHSNKGNSVAAHVKIELTRTAAAWIESKAKDSNTTEDARFRPQAVEHYAECGGRRAGGCPKAKTGSRERQGEGNALGAAAQTGFRPARFMSRPASVFQPEERVATTARACGFFATQGTGSSMERRMTRSKATWCWIMTWS